MLKKLQSLLFEEDDDVEEEDEETEEEEPVRRPAKHKPEPVRKPVVQQEKPVIENTQEHSGVMNRVEITGTVPVVEKKEEKPVVKPAPAGESSVFAGTGTVMHAQPRPVEKKPVEQPAESGFGLMADGAPAERKKPAPVRKPKKDTRKQSAALYEFKPVISPIFGVDEKDVDAMADSARTSMMPKPDEQVSAIISPIYGTRTEDKKAGIQKSVEQTEQVESMTYNRSERQAESSIPEFSLDDILQKRDEQFRRENEKASGKSAANARDIDETVVIERKD